MNLYLTVVVCGALSGPACGQVSHTAGTTLGRTATYSCNTGYNLIGDNTRTCQAMGMWSGSESTCLRMLLSFACRIGETVCSINDLLFTHASHVHVFLTLIVVDCGALTNPANGQVTHPTGTTFGQTATYSCNTGYNLVGDSARTCQATGMWSGSVPTCLRMLQTGYYPTFMHVRSGPST